MKNVPCAYCDLHPCYYCQVLVQCYYYRTSAYGFFVMHCIPPYSSYFVHVCPHTHVGKYILLFYGIGLLLYAQHALLLARHVRVRFLAIKMFFSMRDMLFYDPYSKKCDKYYTSRYSLPSFIIHIYVITHHFYAAVHTKTPRLMSPFQFPFSFCFLRFSPPHQRTEVKVVVVGGIRRGLC